MDNLYEKKTSVSNFNVIISDWRHTLAICLANSHVNFVRRQNNEVVYGRFVRIVHSLVSFHIFIDIPTYI